MRANDLVALELHQHQRDAQRAKLLAHVFFRDDPHALREHGGVQRSKRAGKLRGPAPADGIAIGKRYGLEQVGPELDHRRHRRAERREPARGVTRECRAEHHAGDVRIAHAPARGDEP
jgi:hypothetical protein